MSAPAVTCSTAMPAGPRSSSPVGCGGGGGGMAGDGAGDGAQPSHLDAETPTKPITVTVEEKRVQRVKPGADVTFICTAKSKVSWGGHAGTLGCSLHCLGTCGCFLGHAGHMGTLVCQHYHTGPIATHVAHTDTPGCLPGPAGCRVIPGCPRGHKGHSEAPLHPWSSAWHPDTPGCPPGHWDTFRCPPISMQVPTRTHRTHGHPCVPIRPFLTSLFPPHPPVTCLHPSVDAPEPRDAAVARHGLQRHPDHPQRAA